MFFYKVFSRVSGSIFRTSLLSASQRPQHFSNFSNHLHSLLPQSSNKLIPVQVNLLCPSINSPSPRFGFSSSASTETNERKNNGESDLSRDDLIKRVAEKEELLKLKHKEIEQMKDKVLRTYAGMANVMDRTRRDAENSKKFAIQNFAKSLLDVADNLGRASSVVKESFSKIDTSSDSAEAVKLLKTLLEGVEMTEKQLSEVLKKFGVEKFDPTNEPFDPHRHNAVFQIPDDSKPPGTVAAVLKLDEIMNLLKKVDDNNLQQSIILKNIESSLRHTLSKSFQLFGNPVIGYVIWLILDTIFRGDPNTALLDELRSTVDKGFKELNSTYQNLGVKIENLEEAVTKRKSFWQWMFGTKK